jgi:hypothetical protein
VAECLGKRNERETQVAVLEQFGIRDAKMPAFSVSAIVLELLWD